MLAKEAGILYGSIMTVTDFDCWKDEVVNPADVIECFKQNAEKVSRLIIKAVELIGQEKWDEEIDNLAVSRSFWSVMSFSHCTTNITRLFSLFVAGINQKLQLHNSQLNEIQTPKKLFRLLFL